MLRIVLRRFGKRKLPFFQIIVCARTKRNRWLYKDRVGFIKKAGAVRFMGLDVQKFSYWLLKGANYCTSLVKYFALYTRMHKFEWRTYSKNFKKTEKLLLKDELLNNLLWKWLFYKTKSKFQSNFKHLKFFDFEQDYDGSVSDFTTYLTWKYKKMRRLSGQFVDDVHRYNLRLTNRKYYGYYVRAFSYFLKKQKRNLFRYNILRKLDSIDFLSQNIITGKLRKRLQKFSFGNFLKKIHQRPSFTDYDLWVFDSIKPVERYITLMSTFMHKYNPLKEYIFSLNFRARFFSNENIKLLYLWHKNLTFFKGCSLRLAAHESLVTEYFNHSSASHTSRWPDNVGVLVKKKILAIFKQDVASFKFKMLHQMLLVLFWQIPKGSLNEFKFFYTNYSRFYDNWAEHVEKAVIFEVRLGVDKKFWLAKNASTLNKLKPTLNKFFFLTKQLYKHKFELFVKAFNESFGGPYYFNRTPLYKNILLKYNVGVENVANYKKSLFVNGTKVKQLKYVSFAKFSKLQQVRPTTILNTVTAVGGRALRSFNTFNLTANIQRLQHTLQAHSVKQTTVCGSAKSLVAKRFISKNVDFKRRYVFYKKYNYENISVLMKYSIFLKYTQISVRGAQNLGGNVWVNACVNYRALFLSLTQKGCVVNWVVRLKRPAYLVVFQNLRSEFFFNLCAATSLLTSVNSRLKYCFWSWTLKKSGKLTVKFKGLIRLKNSAFLTNMLLFPKFKIRLYNDCLLSLKRFLGYSLELKQFRMLLTVTLVCSLIKYLKYKFSVFFLLLNGVGTINSGKFALIFFQTKLTEFVVLLDICQSSAELDFSILEQLYQNFLNLQVVLANLEGLLVTFSQEAYSLSFEERVGLVAGAYSSTQKILGLEKSYSSVQPLTLKIPSIIYLRNFLYFDKVSVNKNVINLLFTRSPGVRALFKTQVLLQFSLTRNLARKLKANKSFMQNSERFFNKLRIKFTFEHVWQRVYNLFLQHKQNSFLNSIVARSHKTLLRSKFKFFFFTRLVKAHSLSYKNETKFWNFHKIQAKFQNFLFLQEDLVLYLRAVLKYFYVWTFIYLRFKKSFFYKSLNKHVGIYLTFLVKTAWNWEQFNLGIENTKFVANYDLLLDSVSQKQFNVYQNFINSVQKARYSTYFAEGGVLFEKALDMYVWNILLKNNDFFITHSSKMHSILGFFAFLNKFKRKFKMLKNKLGYFAFLGKYFKMQFLSILQGLRYISSNNALKALLFLWLVKIRKQLKRFSKSFSIKTLTKLYPVGLKWKHTLFKYNFYL